MGRGPDRHRIPRHANVGDVAQLAHVSRATVSRAFNAPDLLQPETLERVREAARKLSYAPYGLARSLRLRRSMVIGMLLPSLRNLYFADTVGVVQSLLRQRGYTMLLASSSYDATTEIEAVRAMVAQGVDGLILLGRPQHAEVGALLRRQHVPFVRSWVACKGEPSIAFDHARAMFEVTRHLVGLGHRRLGAVFPFVALHDEARERLAAIREALAMDGLALPAQALIDDAGFGPEAGRQALLKLRARAPGITAVICSNDNLAVGVILECRAQGLEVPGDVSVTGYNDLEIAAAFEPPITTVRTPLAEHAEKVTDALLKAVESGDAPRSELLETTLVVRGSTAPPKRPRR